MISERIQTFLGKDKILLQISIIIPPCVRSDKCFYDLIESQASFCLKIIDEQSSPLSFLSHCMLIIDV